MSKRNRLRIIPSHLPLIRERVVRAERQLYVHDVPAERAPVWDQMLDICRRDIERKLEAPLFWVSRDMTRLAVDTAEAGDFPTVDPPSDTGWVFFEGGLPLEDTGTSHVTALYWSVEGDGIAAVSYSDDAKVLEWSDAGAFGAPVAIALLDNVRDDVRRAWVDILRAMWALTAQPGICETRPARNDAGNPLPAKYDPVIRTVRIVDVRENLGDPAGAGRDGNGAEGGRRGYSHRFIVRGFWREQPYGPNRSLRRRQWIPPFVKGPADKPLVCKDTVRIWRH